jgi:hypothetical protein
MGRRECKWGDVGGVGSGGRWGMGRKVRGREGG